MFAIFLSCWSSSVTVRTVIRIILGLIILSQKAYFPFIFFYFSFISMGKLRRHLMSSACLSLFLSRHQRSRSNCFFEQKIYLGLFLFLSPTAYPATFLFSSPFVIHLASCIGLENSLSLAQHTIFISSPVCSSDVRGDVTVLASGD